MAKKVNAEDLAIKPDQKKSSKVKKPAKATTTDADDFDLPVWIDPLISAMEAAQEEKAKEVEEPKIYQDVDDHFEREAERISTANIQKAKLKNEIFIYIEYSETIPDGSGTNSIKSDSTAAVHNDLKKAFQKLDLHLAGLAEQFTLEGLLNSGSTTCTGFAIGGEGTGVTLSGYRLLSNGKAFNFNTPFIKWNDPTADYEGARQLRISVNRCVLEVKRYLFENKHQPDIQGKLDLE